MSFFAPYPRLQSSNPYLNPIFTAADRFSEKVHRPSSSSTSAPIHSKVEGAFQRWQRGDALARLHVREGEDAEIYEEDITGSISPLDLLLPTQTTESLRLDAQGRSLDTITTSSDLALWVAANQGIADTESSLRWSTKHMHDTWYDGDRYPKLMRRVSYLLGPTGIAAWDALMREKGDDYRLDEQTPFRVVDLKNALSHGSSTDPAFVEYLLKAYQLPPPPQRQRARILPVAMVDQILQRAYKKDSPVETGGNGPWPGEIEQGEWEAWTFPPGMLSTWLGELQTKGYFEPAAARCWVAVGLTDPNISTQSARDGTTTFHLRHANAFAIFNVDRWGEDPGELTCGVLAIDPLHAYRPSLISVAGEKLKAAVMAMCMVRRLQDTLSSMRGARAASRAIYNFSRHVDSVQVIQGRILELNQETGCGFVAVADAAWLSANPVKAYEAFDVWCRNPDSAPSLASRTLGDQLGLGGVDALKILTSVFFAKVIRDADEATGRVGLPPLPRTEPQNIRDVWLQHAACAIQRNLEVCDLQPTAEAPTRPAKSPRTS